MIYKIAISLLVFISCVCSSYFITKHHEQIFIKSDSEIEAIKQKNCLINALYYEARSEAKLGVLAVASVIENRKNHSSYPVGYCAVVNQYKQFSYTLNDEPDIVKLSTTLTAYDKKAYTYIYRVADKMSTGTFETVLPETVMWYATKKVSNAWTKSKKIYATIGVHHFYMKKDKTK